MAAAIQLPSGEVVEFEEHELRRLVSLADYGIQQKKTLNLPLSTVEAHLETKIRTELRF